MKIVLNGQKNKFQSNFVDKIQALINNFPEDSVTEEGIPFWHPPKRFPHIVPFDMNNLEVKDFIMSTARLRAYNFGIKEDLTEEQINKIVNEYEVKQKEKKEDKEIEEEINECLEAIKGIEVPTVNVVVFEKDDDSNHHIEFIKSCSNLRAENYCIQPADFFQTKFIAGKIIPAMITTTAVVSGLQCLELIKVLEKKPLSSYHSTFLNLAIGYMDSVEPEEVKKEEFCEGLSFSIWDKIELNGDMTLQQFVDKIEEKYPQIEVDSILCGETIFVMSMLLVKKERLSKTLTQVYEEVTKQKYTNSTMTLSITVELKSGEELSMDKVFPDIVVNL